MINRFGAHIGCPKTEWPAKLRPMEGAVPGRRPPKETAMATTELHDRTGDRRREAPRTSPRRRSPASRALWQAVRNRRSVAKLLEWDDRMLRDIGLTQSDVRSAMAPADLRRPVLPPRRDVERAAGRLPRPGAGRFPSASSGWRAARTCGSGSPALAESPSPLEAPTPEPALRGGLFLSPRKSLN